MFWAAPPRAVLSIRLKPRGFSRTRAHQGISIMHESADLGPEDDPLLAHEPSSRRERRASLTWPRQGSKNHTRQTPPPRIELGCRWRLQSQGTSTQAWVRLQVLKQLRSRFLDCPRF